MGIGTTKMNPNCPIYLVQIWHGYLSLVQSLVIFLKQGYDFSFLIDSGTNSYIFGADEKILSLPNYCIFSFM